MAASVAWVILSLISHQWIFHLTQESQLHDTIFSKERNKQVSFITIKRRKQANGPIPETRKKCGLLTQWDATHILKIILIHIYQNIL